MAAKLEYLTRIGLLKCGAWIPRDVGRFVSTSERCRCVG